MTVSQVSPKILFVVILMLMVLFYGFFSNRSMADDGKIESGRRARTPLENPESKAPAKGTCDYILANLDKLGGHPTPKKLYLVFGFPTVKCPWPGPAGRQGKKAYCYKCISKAGKLEYLHFVTRAQVNTLGQYPYVDFGDVGCPCLKGRISED